jgi:hypothetical protein
MAFWTFNHLWKVTYSVKNIKVKKCPKFSKNFLSSSLTKEIIFLDLPVSNFNIKNCTSFSFNPESLSRSASPLPSAPSSYTEELKSRSNTDSQIHSTPDRRYKQNLNLTNHNSVDTNNNLMDISRGRSPSRDRRHSFNPAALRTSSPSNTNNQLHMDDNGHRRLNRTCSDNHAARQRKQGICRDLLRGDTYGTVYYCPLLGVRWEVGLIEKYY